LKIQAGLAPPQARDDVFVEVGIGLEANRQDRLVDNRLRALVIFP
jgi:hypothetical protein